MARIAKTGNRKPKKHRSSRLSKPQPRYVEDPTRPTDSSDLVPSDGKIDPFGQVPGLMNLVAKGLSAERMKLAEFMRMAWKTVNPGTPLIWNWHLDLVSEYLEALHLGQIKHLCFNLPPRFSKSFAITISFPCWEWSEDPTVRYMFTSYAQKLCNRHSLDRRAILASDWYQERWGSFVKLAEDQNLKTEYQNTARGVMVTMPIGGTATGSGGRRLIMDDPMDPKRAESKLIRASTIEFITKTLSTRLDDRHSSKILVEQRLHKGDATGSIVTEQEGWVHVAVPIRAKSTRVYKFPISGRVKTMVQGELLCEERKNDDEIKELEGPKQLGDRAAMAQLYQQPSDQDGVKILRTYWQFLKDAPRCEYMLWVWDCAVKDKDGNSYSVGMLMGLWQGRVVIFEVIRKRMEYPDLKKAVRNAYERKPTACILVEDKSAGQQIIQDLSRGDEHNDALPVIGTEPDFNKLDKSQRLALVLSLWEAGLVCVVKTADGNNPDWYQTLEDECAEFPDGDFDDQVDTAVHGAKHLKDMMAGGGEDDEGEERTDDVDDL